VGDLGAAHRCAGSESAQDPWSSDHLPEPQDEVIIEKGYIAVILPKEIAQLNERIAPFKCARSDDYPDAQKEADDEI
jgi:hypothetical protein